MGNLLGAIGQAQPVSQFINTAMQVGQYQQNSALRGMQTERERLALDEERKKQEHLDTVVDFKLTPFYLALPESARPQAEQMFKGLGAFDENYRGPRRQMYQAVEEIGKSAPALKSLMEPVIDAKAQGVVKAFEAYRKNPEDPRLKSAYEQSQVEHAASSGKILDYIKGLEAQESATFHNIPEGGTGVLINKRGEQVGTPIQGAPKDNALADDRRYREIIIKGKAAPPDEQSWAAAYEKQKTLGPVLRAEVFKEIAGEIRQTPVYDKESGSITFATANEIKANPDRFAPPAAQQKVQGQQALIQDIKGQIGRTSTALQNMRSDFSPDQRAKIVLVLQHRDPGSAWSNFMGSNWASTLSDDQKDYVVSLLQLKEQSMAMRSVLGAGQGSDMMREAIDKTLPGMISPDRKFALKQLNEFNQTVYRLEKFVPKGSATPGVEQPAPLGGGSVSTADEFLRKKGLK